MSLFHLAVVPSRPLHVTFKEVSNSTVAVHWQEPTTPNGVIAGYRIYYMHDDFTDVMTVRATEHTMYYILRGLSKLPNVVLVIGILRLRRNTH